ncbi:hypothetical protein CSHISOI_11463, partial [Colletotrichum shisoi]
MWHKQLIVGIIVLCLCLLTALSALIVYMMPDYQREGITPDQISNLFTVPNLLLGIGNLVSMPIAMAVGRRPVMLASTVLLFMSAVLCATNRNYWQLEGRMVASFAAAQCQALALLVIQVKALVIASSYVSDALGWKSWYWMFAGLSGAAMILTFLFVAETGYDRPIEAFMGTHPSDIGNLLPAHLNYVLTSVDIRGQSPGPEYTEIGEGLTADSGRYKERTFGSNLQIFVHKPSWSRFWLCLKKIGQVFLFTPVLWVAIDNGLFQGINVSIQMTYAEVLVKPSYSWANTSVSLIQLGQVFVAILSLILTVLYGYVLENPEKFHWMAIVCIVDRYLIVLLGANTVGMTYLIDSHPSFAGAILVALPVTRGLVGFGISKHPTQYIANIGSVMTFGIFAA